MSEIDLSRLPPPDVVERLSYQDILAAMVADLRGRDIEFTAFVESDPVFKMLEVAAYREFLLRGRVNDAVRSVLLATAQGPDLQQLGALLGVERLDGESDDALRRRMQLAPASYSSAGPEGAYRFVARSADPRVKDVGLQSPAPINVLVTVLGGDHPDGAADAALVAIVEAALSGEEVRPMTDVVTVRGAEILPYLVTAKLTVSPGPDREVVRQASEDALRAYCLSVHAVGATVRRSALFAAAHVAGVIGVTLAAPAADVVATAAQAPWCTADSRAPYGAPDTHPLDGITVTVA